MKWTASWADTTNSGTEPEVVGTALQLAENTFGNIKLTAVWDPISYTISYVLDGGTLPSGAVKTYTIESTDALPEVTKTGYSFKTWKVSTASGNWLANSVADAGSSLLGKFGDVTLTATWQTDAVEVTLNGNVTDTNTASPNVVITPSNGKAYIAYMDTNFYTGWSGQPPLNHTTGEVVKPVAKRNGYVFTGWWTKSVGGEQVLTESGVLNSGVAGLTDENGNWISTANVEIYAQWTKLTNIEVTFDLNIADMTDEEASVTPATKTVVFDEAYGELAVATRKGYSFGGWFKDKALSNEIKGTSMVSDYENHNLYAKWTINQYTLTINPNGGVYNESQEITTVKQDYKTTVTLTPPTRVGYGFDGWTLTGEGSENDGVFTFGAGDATLTAKWTSQTFSVTLNQDDENVTAGTRRVSVVFNSNLITPEIINPTRIGYVFEGWTKTKGGDDFVITASGRFVENVTIEGFISNGKWIGAADQTVYAKWTANNYTISYVAGDEELYGSATGEVVSTDAVYDQNVTLASNAFVLRGYTFSGWQDAEGNVYEDGETLTKPNFSSAVNGTYTLTATWTANKYQISVTGDTEATDTIEVVYGKAYVGDEKKFVADANAYNKMGYNLTGFADANKLFVIDKDGLLIEGVSMANGTLITDGNIWAYAGNIVLEAQYSAKEYTLNFNVVSTTPPETTPTVEFESKKIYYDQTFGQDGKWQSAYGPGYYFDGWTLQNNVRPVNFEVFKANGGDVAFVEANKDEYLFARGQGEKALTYLYVETTFADGVANPDFTKPVKFADVQKIEIGTMLNDKQGFFENLDKTGEITIYATWIGRVDIEHTIYFLQEEIVASDTAPDFNDLDKDKYNQPNVTEGQIINYKGKTYKVVKSLTKDDALIADKVENYIKDKYGFEGFSFSGYEFMDSFIQPDTDDAMTKIYGFYDRQEFTLNISMGKGVISISASGNGVTAVAGQTNVYSVAYGADVLLTANIKVGYTFAAWENVAGFTSVTTALVSQDPSTRVESFKMPVTTLGVSLKATATAKTTTKYTIEYYKQNIADDGFTKFGDAVEKTGETDTEVDLQDIKADFEGFTYKTYYVKSSQIADETEWGSLNIEGDESLVIKVYYKRNSYTLTINYFYKGTTTPIREAVVETLKFEETYSHTSESVTGFTIDDKDVTISGSMPANDLTINVFYTPIVYTITYETDGGTISGTADADYTQTFTIESQIKFAVVAKTGWAFDGWKVTSDHTDATLGNFVTGTIYKEKTQDAGMWGNVTLTAQWKANTDTVYKFNIYLMNVNGNYTDVDPIVVERNDGTTAEKLLMSHTETTLSVNGTDYAYTGFAIDEANSTLENVTVSADGSTEFDVRFKRNQYTFEIEKQEGISSVKVGINGGVETEYSSSLQVYYQSQIKLVVSIAEGSSWEGYEVVGTTPTGLVLSNSPEAMNQEVSMGLGNTKLVAKASTNTYSLTIKANGGLYQGESELVVNRVYKTTYTFDTPIRTGYTFTGWTLGDGAKGTIEESIDKNGQTIYTYTFGAGDDIVTANWSVNRYELLLNFNDVNFSNGTTEAKIEKIKTDKNANLEIANGKLSLYIEYASDFSKLYTSVNGDDFVSFAAFDSTNVQRDGYLLTGWATALAGGENVAVDDVCDFVVTKEIFAHWQAQTYTLTISKPLDKLDVAVQNATKLEENKYEVVFDQTITLSASMSEGYHFVSYKIEENVLSDKSQYDYAFTIAGDVTIAANAGANSYTISYDANTGAGAVEDTEATFDADTTLSDGNGFKKTGYTLVGWYFEETNKEYKPSQTISDNLTSTNGGKVVLKAIWQANGYSIKFDTNGGSEVLSISATYDEAKLLDGTTTKKGWDFVGWSTKNGQSLDDVTQITEEGITDVTKYLLDNNKPAGIYVYADVIYAFNLRSENADEITLYAVWTEGAADFERRYYIENFDGTYILDTSVTEFGSDFVSHSETVKSTTNANATIDTEVTYVGFTLDLSVEGTKTEGIVLADGSLVLAVYYRRNVYAVTFSLPDLGVASATATTDTVGGAGENPNTFKYNANVTINVIPAKGYRFDEIVFGDEHITTTSYSFSIEEDSNFVVNVTALEFDYFVRFEFETLDGTDFTQREIADVKLTATVDTLITYEMIAEVIADAEVKIVGFTYKEFDMTKTVLPVVEETDEAQIVVVRYSRNSYDLTLKLVTGVESFTATADGFLVKEKTDEAIEGQTTYAVRYEAEVNLSITIEEGYAFGSWSDEIVVGEKNNSGNTHTGFKIEKMPAENKLITAIVTTLEVDFTVIFNVQNMAGDGFIEHSRETRKGFTRTEIQSVDGLNLKEIEGFSYSTFETGVIIAGDGSSELNVYYIRNSVNVKVGLSEGVASVSVTVSETGYEFTQTFTEAGEFSLKYGATATLSAERTNEGYTLTGFTGGVSQDETDKHYYIVAGTNNFDITATAENNKYTITFNANGGKLDGSADLTYVQENVVYNRSVTLDANRFVRMGYRFDSWNTLADGTGISYAEISSFNYEVMGDLTLYAIWTAIKYNVEYSPNGGVGKMEGHTDVVFDQEFTLRENAFTKTGFTFDGWFYTDDEGNKVDIDKSTTAVKNLTAKPSTTVILNANWSENSYKVVYNSNYSSIDGDFEDVSSSEETFLYTQEFALKNAIEFGFTLPGYTFVGWTSDKANQTNVLAAGTTVSMLATGETDNDKAVLYAVWEPVHYFIAFDKNTGSGDMTQIDAIYGEDVTLPENTFEKTGYTFAGWALSATGDVVYADKAVVRNLANTTDAVATLYAKWDAIVYTITVDANKGTFKDLDLTAGKYVYTYTIADEISLVREENLARRGFTLLGYTIKSNANGNWSERFVGSIVFEDLQEGSLVSGLYGDVELVAAWSVNRYLLTINYEYLDGSEALPTYTAFVDFEGDFEVTSQEIAGYTPDKAVVSGTMDAEPQTFTVVYSPNKYTIVFDLNDDLGTSRAELKYNENNVTSVEVVYKDKYANAKIAGVENPVGLIAPTRAGYRFAGWWTSTAFDTRITNDSIVEILQTTTLYAKWEAVETTYFIDFKFETLDGSEFVLDEELKASLTGTGISDTMVTEDMVKAVCGGDYPIFDAYNFKNVELVNIDANGTARVALNYERKYFNLTISKSIGIDEVVVTTEEVLLEGQDDDFYIAKLEDNLYSVRFGATIKVEIVIGNNGYAFDRYNATGAVITTSGNVANFDVEESNISIEAVAYAKHYTITYHGNKGQTSAGDESYVQQDGEGQNDVVYMKEVVLVANRFARTGYIFKGWATSEANAEAKIVDYPKEAVYKMTEYVSNVDLYAVWEPIPYRVILEASAGIDLSKATIVVGDEARPYEEGMLIDFDSVVKVYYKYPTEGGEELSALAGGYDFANFTVGENIVESEEVFYEFTLKGETIVKLNASPRTDTKFEVRYSLKKLDEDSYVEVEADRFVAEGETDRIVDFDYLNSLKIVKEYEGFAYSAITDGENLGSVVIRYHNDDKNYTVVEIRYVRLAYNLTLSTSIGVQDFYPEVSISGNMTETEGIYKIVYGTPTNLVLNMLAGYSFDDFEVSVSMMKGSVPLTDDGKTSWILTKGENGFYFEGKLVLEIVKEDGVYKIASMPAYAVSINTISHANNYSITYNRNLNDEDSEIDEVDVTFNTAYNIKNIKTLGWSKPGYDFVGWATSKANASATNPVVQYTFEDDNDLSFASYDTIGDIELWAVWTPADVVYKIEYYFENVDGSYSINNAFTKNLEGKTDSTASYVLLAEGDVSGFEFDETHKLGVLSGKIEADGSLVLKVYYSRLWFAFRLSYDVGFDEISVSSSNNNIKDLVVDEENKLITANVKYGANVTITKQIHEGYEFTGYKVTPTNLIVTDDSFVMPVANVSIVAETDPIEYTLTFKTEFGGFVGTGGEIVTSHEQKFVYLTKNNLWTNRFERNGYTFLGWSLTKEGEVEYTDGQMFEYNFARDLEFVAVWEKNRDTNFTVNFYLQNIDGSRTLKSITLKGATDEVITKKLVEEAFELIDVNHDGYYFVKIRESSPIIVGDGTGLASAEYDLVGFNVDFDFEDERGEVVGISKVSATYQTITGDETKTIVSGDNESVLYTAKLTLKIDFVAGYKLKQVQVTGATYSNTITTLNADGSVSFIMPSEAIEVKVVVQTETYAIKFFKNFKLDVTYTTQEVRYLQENVSLVGNYVETGYTLLGWATSSSGIVEYELGETIPKYTMTEGLELYAVWEKNEYVVSFSNNGGTGNILDINVKYDEITDLPDANGFTKVGYQFVGWSRNSDEAQFTTVNNQSEISASGIYFNRATGRFVVYNLATGNTDDNHVILYAIWTPIKYSVTLSYAETAEQEKPLGELAYDSDYTIQAFSSLGWRNQGYEFVGWYYYDDAGQRQEIDCDAETPCTIRNLTATNGKEVKVYVRWGLGDAEFTIRILLETLSGEYGAVVGHYKDITGNTIRTESVITSEYVYNQYLSKSEEGKVEGFEYLKSFQATETVLGNGSTIIVVRYSRRYFNLVVNLQNSVSKVVIATENNTHMIDNKNSSDTRIVWSVMFGDKVTLTVSESQGFKDPMIELVADESVEGVVVNGFSFYMKGTDGIKDLAGNITINALAVPRDDTTYNINIFKQSLNLDYADAPQTISGTGTTGALIDPEAVKLLVIGNSTLDFAGFTFGSVSLEDVAIKGDGTSVVNVYFTRNSYAVFAETENQKAIDFTFENAEYLFGQAALITFNLNKGYTLVEETDIKVLDADGNDLSDVTYKVVKAETPSGIIVYTINLTVPAQAVTIRLAPHKNTDTVWKISYLFESLNMDGTYEKLAGYPDIEKTGETEQALTINDLALDGIEIAGFALYRTTLEDAEHVLIKGDGSTVVIVYFNRLRKNVKVTFVDANKGYVDDSFTILVKNKTPEVVSTMVWSVGFGQTITTNLRIGEGFDFGGYMINGKLQTNNVTGTLMTYVVGSKDDVDDEEVEITITIIAKTNISYTLQYFVQSKNGGTSGYGDSVLKVVQTGTTNAYLSQEFIQKNFIEGLANLPGYREEDFKGVLFGYYTATMHGEPVDIANIYIAGDKSTTIKFYYALRLITVAINYDDEQIESVRGEGSYAFGAEVTISAKPKVGYRFVSWEIIKGGDEDNKLIVTTNEYTLIIDDDVDIRLNVESDVADTTFTVEFYFEVLGQLDFGQPQIVETKDGVTEAEININLLKREFDGYEFERYTCDNSEEIIFGDGTTTVRLYYLLKLVEFEISSEEGVKNVTVEAGNPETPLELISVNPETGAKKYRTKHTGKISLSVSVEKGFEFQGWRKNGRLVQGSNETVGFLLDIEHDTKTIVGSVAPKQIIIIYEPNDGTAQSRTFIVNYGDQISFINNPFKAGKKTFLGWSTTADGDVVYFADDIVTVDDFFLEGTNGSAITLYAVWREKSSSNWWIWLIVAILILLLLILIVVWIIHKRRRRKARMMAKQ